MPTTFEARGHGLHTGVPCAVRISRGPAGSGVVFRTAAGEVAANARNIDPTAARATDLIRLGVRVRTVEHLMAAFAAMGRTDVEVELDGPEVPALDGCAAAWVDLLARAGGSSSPRPIILGRSIEMKVGDSSGTIVPVDAIEDARYSAELEYGDDAVGDPRASFRPFADDFAAELAPARTFAIEREVRAMLDAGLAKGGSLDNALVIGERGPLNAEGMRFANEPARHKLLDLIGDLYLAGGLPVAAVTVRRPGHALNHALARAVAAARA